MSFISNHVIHVKPVLVRPSLDSFAVGVRQKVGLRNSADRFFVGQKQECITRFCCCLINVVYGSLSGSHSQYSSGFLQYD
jgi:hypothetical protein